MVYVLNEEDLTWESTSDMSGGLFFVCNEIMFCVSAKDFGLPERDYF